MVSMERKKYISKYYLSFLDLVENIENKNTNIYNIQINWIEIEYWKVKWVDKIIQDFIYKIKTEWLKEIEKEIFDDLKDNI